jgi:hypothetical protein
MLSVRPHPAVSVDRPTASAPLALPNPAGDVEALPGELERVVEALRAAGSALEAACGRVVPQALPGDRGVCDRYARAAASWPVSPPPSYERFAEAATSLHDAAGTARLAARRCEEARRTLAALLRTRR